MSPRLIIVSNRVAVPEPGNKHDGGRARGRGESGAEEPHRRLVRLERRDQRRRSGGAALLKRNRVTYAVIDLSKTDFQEYYNGFANRVLWPILHYRVDLQEYSRADQSGYMRVNRSVRRQLGAFIEDDDVIWVHDYHLMPLARELRARGRLNPIGYFCTSPARRRTFCRRCRITKTFSAASPITTWLAFRPRTTATISPTISDLAGRQERAAAEAIR